MTRSVRIRFSPSAACRSPSSMVRVRAESSTPWSSGCSLQSAFGRSRLTRAGMPDANEGDSSARDAVYHQGTVWPWLAGPFVEAWLRVRRPGASARREARRRFVHPLLGHLQVAGLGHVSEIADAEAPFTPRGCPFQAWSLGELLRLERIVLNPPQRTVELRERAYA